jgi:hypothetical protein
VEAALRCGTTSCTNAGIRGVSVSALNTTGNYNTAVGNEALVRIAPGHHPCIAIGQKNNADANAAINEFPSGSNTTPGTIHKRLATCRHDLAPGMSDAATRVRIRIASQLVSGAQKSTP